MIERSYPRARAELADLMDRAVDDRETVIIERRGCSPRSSSPGRAAAGTR